VRKYHFAKETIARATVQLHPHSRLLRTFFNPPWQTTTACGVLPSCGPTEHVSVQVSAAACVCWSRIILVASYALLTPVRGKHSGTLRHQLSKCSLGTLNGISARSSSTICGIEAWQRRTA
jgi:hypothetical protein